MIVKKTIIDTRAHFSTEAQRAPEDDEELARNNAKPKTTFSNSQAPGG